MIDNLPAHKAVGVREAIEARGTTLREAAQFHYLQAYDSSPEGLKRLFTQLFFEEQAIPGMKQIAFDAKKEELEKDAHDLSKLFQPAAVADVCGRFIDIEHKQGIKYDKIEDLLWAQILDMKNLTEAFDRYDTFQGTFGELIVRLKKGGASRRPKLPYGRHLLKR